MITPTSERPVAGPTGRWPDLPVTAVLGELVSALADASLAVLEAPPGAGKTTVVPLALLEAGVDGRIVLLEPRRVAARAAATRLAHGLGERLGATVGLTTRDASVRSAATRIEVVTEGVLLRRLQRDPELAGVGLVMFDEFHERNLQADLSLAFALEARAALRPDLRLLVTSATLDGERTAALLGGAPVVRAEGRIHPVEVDHRPRPDRRHLDVAVRDAVAEVLADAGPGAGDVLVFLPGVAEIRRAARALASDLVPGDPVVRPLHGSLPPREQDAALAPTPAGRRKVVLATDVAESSLTIDGVTAVVDAGWSREPRFDAATGMTGLVTVAASRASADQRAGRAGRTAPGRCVRLWPASEHPARDAHPRPAIATDDLTDAALQVAAWGTDVADLALLDPPPTAAWQRARATLADLGALDDGGTVTSHGRELVRLPVHPRLGHLLVRGRGLGLGALACEVAAVLTDRDPLTGDPGALGVDLATRVAVLRGAEPPPGARRRPGALERARRDRDRLRRLIGLPRRAERSVDDRPGDGAGDGADDGADDLDEVGALVSLGWPDRIALRRGERRGSFLLAAGRGAEVPEQDVLAGAPWLAVAHLDRGVRAARVHLAAAVDHERLLELHGDRMHVVEEVAWRDGDVVADRSTTLGALVVSRQRLARPQPGRLLAALLDGVRSEGLDLLGWRPEDRQLQARIGLLYRVLGAPWPDVSDPALLADLEAVLGPFLLRARRRRDVAELRVGDVLRSRLPAKEARQLERLAPTHLEVPSGSRVRLDYTAGDRPVLAVRVQEVFGAERTPAVVDGRVPVLLHLLSPARRPVQVTDDLAGFWQRAYPEVRAQLRGRYPKHDWPEDPVTAVARRGTRRRR